MCAQEGITPREMEAEENIKRLQEELLKQDVILKTAH
jgi:hypothetical protein